MKRPTGVWIIGIVAFLSGLLELLAGLTALGVGGLSLIGVLGIDPDVAGGRAVAAGVITIIIAFLYLLFAVSFLGLRRWAWVALLIVSIVSIAAVALQVVFDGFYWSSIAAIVLPLIVIFYLTRPRVRRAFRR